MSDQKQTMEQFRQLIGDLVNKRLESRTRLDKTLASFLGPILEGDPRVAIPCYDFLKTWAYHHSDTHGRLAVLHYDLYAMHKKKCNELTEARIAKERDGTATDEDTIAYLKTLHLASIHHYEYYKAMWSIMAGHRDILVEDAKVAVKKTAETSPEEDELRQDIFDRERSIERGGDGLSGMMYPDPEADAKIPPEARNMASRAVDAEVAAAAAPAAAAPVAAADAGDVDMPDVNRAPRRSQRISKRAPPRRSQRKAAKRAKLDV